MYKRSCDKLSLDGHQGTRLLLQKRVFCARLLGQPFTEPFDAYQSMKFRASIENVPTFYRAFCRPSITWHTVTEMRIQTQGLIQAIEKLQKKCIIKFTEKDLRMICNSESNEGGIQVWSCVFPQF